jgi:uncharacterized membrane protein YqhA
MIRRILAGSRYLIIIAVLGSFVAAAAVLIADGLTVINVIIDSFTHAVFTSESIKHIAVEGVEIIDLFLLGTTLYIIALGLYDLFIDNTLPMPPWLHFRSLDDLKERILSVVVVLLAVSFLGDIVNWNGSNSILSLGVAVGFVLLALGLILSQVFKTAPIAKLPSTSDKDNDTTQVE